ncbi:MAG: hypothetical protein ACFBSE_22480 [Prochloraceae cyanobacterium]
MKSSLTLEIINSISLKKIQEYLSIKGWKKKKEISGTASIWIRSIAGEKYGIILPLDREFIDFQDRLIEVFNILEEIEQRPKIEIIESLKNTSKIARQQNREIIEIKISSLDGNKKEVESKNIGLVLKSLQDFFDEFGVLKFQDKPQADRSKLKSQLEMSLIDTFHGSFGIRLGLSKKLNYKQLKLFEDEASIDEISIEITETFIKIIQASSDSNTEILKKQIAELKGKSILKFKSLISYLITLKSDLLVDWGSVNPEKGGFAKISYSDIVRTLDIIEKQELEEPVTFEIIGKLVVAGVGKNKKRRKFVLLDSKEDREFQGTIAKEVVDKFDGNIELNKLYRITLEETLSINRLTQEERTTYTIIKLGNII